MKESSHDSGDGLSAFEARLRGSLPAPLPEGFFSQMEERVAARKAWSFVRLGWVAAAALLIIGFWIGFETMERPREGGLSSVPGVSLEMPASPLLTVADDGLVETTDVIGAEDAGTVPSDEGFYRIVRVTLVHRTVGRTMEADVPRVLSEETSEQYVAVPLEIF